MQGFGCPGFRDPLCSGTDVGKWEEVLYCRSSPGHGLPKTNGVAGCRPSRLYPQKPVGEKQKAIGSMGGFRPPYVATDADGRRTGAFYPHTRERLFDVARGDKTKECIGNPSVFPTSAMCRGLAKGRLSSHCFPTDGSLRLGIFRPGLHIRDDHKGRTEYGLSI